MFLAYIGARGYNRHSQKYQGDKNRGGCVLAFAGSKRPHRRRIRDRQKCQGDKNRGGCVLAFAGSKRPHGGA